MTDATLFVVDDDGVFKFSGVREAWNSGKSLSPPFRALAIAFWISPKQLIAKVASVGFFGSGNFPRYLLSGSRFGIVFPQDLALVSLRGNFPWISR